MEIKVNKRSVFYILLSVLFLLIGIRYIFLVEIPRVFLTAVVVLIAAMGNQNEIIAIAIGCIPLHNAISFYIAITALAGILLFKSIKRIRSVVPAILIALIIALELLHCFVHEWTLIMLLTSLAPFLFLAVFLSIDMQNIDCSFVVRTMSIIAFFVCTLQLLNFVIRADGNLTVAFTSMTRLGLLSDDETLFGGMINPNSLGVINVLCATGLWQLRALGSKNKFELVLLISLLVFGVLTMSRTFLLCLLIMAFLFMIAQKGVMKKLRFFGVILLITFTSLLMVMWLFPGVITDFIERFQVNDITNGRSDIMGAYHEYITSNTDVMFFGVGLSDLAKKVTEVYVVYSEVPHNNIQEILVAWGIPGLLLIGSLIAAMIIQSFKYCKRKYIFNYIPLIIILAKCMAGQMITSGYTMLALAFAYLSLCQNFHPAARLDKESL